MPSPIPLEITGTFGIGCNYWASHAGTSMWSNWQPEIVEADFQKLAAHGIEWLRVFTLWPDFQPITQLRGPNGISVEIRMGEEPLPFDPIGQAGVSRVMLERFAEFCELAEKYHLKLIVGLVTGWMSGRLFTPPALNGLDPITDATSISWQIKLVRTIVNYCLAQKAIVAWDLGNECNCMGLASSRDQAYVWTAAISNTIHAADASRPVVSGMHSLGTPRGKSRDFAQWTIDDQGDLTDILTTHPYPYWTRHTRADSVNSLRTTLHATAETRFYADISGKPCFAEEIGTMGPMVASDDASADFARVNLFSLWANDCRAFLWWCASDQTELSQAPYDWTGVELELGLLRIDGTAKPVLREMGAFRSFLAGLPFAQLPKRQTDALCLLTQGQDDWAAVYGAFVLGKQAGLEMEFRHIQQEIPLADLYLLPSLSGTNCLPRRQWITLLERVKKGATIYLSLHDGIVPYFNEVAGVKLISRAQRKGPLAAAFTEAADVVLPLLGGDDLFFTPDGATVLASRPDTGSPVFWRHSYGDGKVLVYASPLEIGLSLEPGAFDASSPPFWRVYQQIAKTSRQPRLLQLENPALAVTEHVLPDGSVVIIAINHTAIPQTIDTLLNEDTKLGTIWRGQSDGYGRNLLIDIPPFDAVVFSLKTSIV